jgi:hypothetical protein
MRYTQSELYYYFRKEIPKKFNPRIEYSIPFEGEVKKNFFIINDERLKIAEELSDFKLESIEFFVSSNQEEFKRGQLCELERFSFELISKLIMLEKDSIPRILIERNFNSKI